MSHATARARSRGAAKPVVAVPNAPPRPRELHTRDSRDEDAELSALAREVFDACVLFVCDRALAVDLEAVCAVRSRRGGLSSD